jgi:hypothetical protein
MSKVLGRHANRVGINSGSILAHHYKMDKKIMPLEALASWSIKGNILKLRTKGLLLGLKHTAIRFVCDRGCPYYGCPYNYRDCEVYNASIYFHYEIKILSKTCGADGCEVRSKSGHVFNLTKCLLCKN